MIILNLHNLWGKFLIFGEGNILNFLFYGAIILIFFLILSKQKFMKKRYMKNIDFPSSLYREKQIIPSLTPYEVALFIRDHRIVILLFIISQLLHGTINIESTYPLRIKKKDEVDEISPIEKEFIKAIENDGRLCKEKLESIFYSISHDLVKKIWLSDKTMLRHFLTDKTELIFEHILEKGGTETIEEVQWFLLHAEIDSTPFVMPALKSEKVFSPLTFHLPENSLKRFLQEISLGIYEQMSKSEEFHEEAITRIFHT